MKIGHKMLAPYRKPGRKWKPYAHREERRHNRLLEQQATRDWRRASEL